ncbi:MerR family transcriptional regulator [Spiribacter halobius]|uniref:MerR family transcriptional regulator n=3 Tax=Sediminicurvatus halobius TaxID=2182432 RepID=A0A2U2MWA6_9GAMM|nr:MerR family transcriptional regulator [Spiribacter halobius]PWG61133.1 MerR family transcriptional regulator [Spiribacter halobius]UEX77707.1 MerR family transcriptional regulator [Spiribacter halobius]
MRIGELSRRTGVSVRMLRYYEARGLLQPQRRASGYREYSPADERTVRRIRALSAAGLKLETIVEILPCIKGEAIEFEPCDKLKKRLRDEADAIAQQIDSLQASHALLMEYLHRAE